MALTKTVMPKKKLLTPDSEIKTKKITNNRLVSRPQTKAAAVGSGKVEAPLPALSSKEGEKRPLPTLSSREGKIMKGKVDWGKAVQLG